LSLAGWLEIGLTLALVLAAAYPIGAFIADVFDNRATFLSEQAASPCCDAIRPDP
jgi:predicted MFS family arabinose efflux permease